MRAGWQDERPRGGAVRLSVLVANANAGALLKAAMLAEKVGIDQFWVGDPDDPAEPYGDDRYVLTTLAVIAARTREIRLGAILHKLGDKDALTWPEFLHTLEDLAIVDHASNGRLEVAFAPVKGDWISRIQEGFRLWTDGLPVGDGRIVALTPAPAQAELPRLVIGADVAGAKRLSAGLIVNCDEIGGVQYDNRIVLRINQGRSVADWLRPDPVGVVQALRLQCLEAHAREVMVRIGSESVEDDIDALGHVILSALHCAPGDTAKITADAWAWFNDGRVKWREPEAMARMSNAFLRRR